jgi:hypothetical protein
MVSLVRRRLEAAAVVAAMTVVAVNIPLGATVAGLWVASRIASGASGGVSMAAVGAFVLVAGALAIALTLVLGALGSFHDALLGRPRGPRRHAAWMRPMGGEGRQARIGALDVVVVGVVACAVLAFELWFLFVSGSPLDGGSGRN